jgi:hypothetical protein
MICRIDDVFVRESPDARLTIALVHFAFSNARLCFIEKAEAARRAVCQNLEGKNLFEFLEWYTVLVSVH